jgi:hypothetical protein
MPLNVLLWGCVKDYVCRTSVDEKATLLQGKLKKCEVGQEEYAELIHQFDVNSAARGPTLKLKLK